MFRHTYPDGTFEQTFYDAEGRRTNALDRAGRSTSYVHDKLGRATHTIFADGATNQILYDAAGRVQATIDARGTITAFGYDDAGRRTSVTNALGTDLQVVSRYQMDAVGNLTNVIDPLGRSTVYEFDRLNRQVRTVYPATVSGGQGTTTLTAYDILGRRVAETNEADIVTRFGYDALGRLIAVTNAHGASEATWATYAYDETGNQTNQVDALARVTRYEYDQLGRRIRRVLPGNEMESFVYNAVGSLLVHTNFINSLVITNEYDSMNRLVRKWSGSNLLESHAYTVTGQRASRTDQSGSYAWIYDNRDRIRTNFTPVGKLYYSYDRQGNLMSLFSGTPNGVSIAYEYDPLNRVTNVIDNRLTGSHNTAYTFDSVGNLRTLRYPNAVTNLWEYDTRNRLTNQVWKLHSTPLASFYYQLGVAGNRTNLIECVNGVSRIYSWRYDKLYRLTNESISSLGALAYAYDRASNRTNRGGSLGSLDSASYTYNTNDRLSTDIYDANGNTINSAGIGYAYDWANRLTNSGSISFVYNADSHRIRKTTSTATTLYLVDERNLTGYPQVVEELTASGSFTNVSRVFTYGLDLVSQWQSDGSIHLYGHDGHGSVRFLANGSGAITDSYSYDAYGTLIASNGTTPNVYLYTGERFDPDLGFYVVGKRYLKTDTGRFWTSDSFEGFQNDALSLHKYLYAHADPVNYSDPSGTSRRISATTGYPATGAGQHIIPFSTWDEIGFSYEAMEYLDEGNALLPAPGHDPTAHPRYTHEVRAEWERFLDSPAGKKYKSNSSYGRNVAKAFLEHVKTAGNPYIDGFNAAVGGGPDAVRKWFKATGHKIPIAPLKTSIWKGAAERLKKRIPYLKYLVAGATYASALETARAARDSEAVAQLEALAEVLNPLPFSQQDIRDAQGAGLRYWNGRQRRYEFDRFGDLLD